MLYGGLLAMWEWEQPDSKRWARARQVLAVPSLLTCLTQSVSIMDSNHPSGQQSFQLTEVNLAAPFDTIRDISLSIFALKGNGFLGSFFLLAIGIVQQQQRQQRRQN